MIPQVRFIDSPIVFGHPPRTPRPAWATYHDRMTDLSDVWIECCDPESVHGALVTGYYSARTVDAWDARHDATEATLFDLDGVSVTTADGTAYHDRADLVRMWGQDTIDRVERCEMEAA